MSEPSTPVSGESLKLHEALALLSSQTAAMFRLRGFYTATVLGSLAFGISSHQTRATAGIFSSASGRSRWASSLCYGRRSR